MKKENTKFERFDRKTFNPDSNDIDLSILYKLRNKGWTRRIAFRQAERNDFKGCPPNTYHHFESSAMWTLRLLTEPWEENKKIVDYKGKVFCDFGCGQSPDTAIAIKLGFKKAIAIDLFKVRTTWDKGVEFLEEDVCEKLSLGDDSIDHAVCQAVLDLIKPEERHLFYKNAFRVLKPGGYLSVYIVKLHVGYGHNILREIENSMDVGFDLVRKFNDGFVVQKI